MEGLNFHKPELDGRNRCKSISPNDNACVMERDHTLEHYGSGEFWTDAQERKESTSMDSKWLTWMVRLIGLAVCLTTYGMLQAYFNPHDNIPLWFLVVSLAALAAIFACCAGYILSGVKRDVKKNYHG